ncbi:MAG: PhoU domain-containing protein [Gammaproteobacteria bacterium]|nr:PhoU domain-containing protein [Gammaproteobacteria bacterium]
MAFPKSIRENLRFLIAEVGAQLGVLQSYLESPLATLGKRILDREGYAGNLKQRIHNSCLDLLANGAEGDVNQQLIRAVEMIATYLDRMAEHAREVVQETSYLQDASLLVEERYDPLLDPLLQGLEWIESAFCEQDNQEALKIGEIEQELDRVYRDRLKRYTKALRQRKQTEDLVCLIFVAHHLEQMGDEMLDISEAIISANMGQPFNTSRYSTLSASMAKLGEKNIDDLGFELIAETRSGSGIAGITLSEKTGEGYDAIYKDGEKRKLKEERQGVENWHEIFPGLAPKILSYHKRGQSAALLIEHLAGLTFEQILLHEPNKLLKITLRHLTETLASVWQETRSKKKASADYMGQLSKRLDDVYAIHPEFQQAESRVGDLAMPSFDQLLERAVSYEKKLEAPFSVYIHGDFNVDNIIYDPVEKRISFIDLHRSRYMDYVQDVTVFMVSIYRLQVLDKQVRERILRLAVEFCEFARKFARKQNDLSFEIRLTLGLVRSFATSTRFILDKSLSRAMFLRARYLLERVLKVNPKDPAGFQVPIKEIFVG